MIEAIVLFFVVALVLDAITPDTSDDPDSKRNKASERPHKGGCWEGR